MWPRQDHLVDLALVLRNSWSVRHGGLPLTDSLARTDLPRQASEGRGVRLPLDPFTLAIIVSRPGSVK